MITLRDYQAQLVEDARKAYASGKKAPLLVLPTGGGKTTIFAHITHRAADRGKCVFLICHRAELVKQISMTLGNFGCPHQIIAPPPIINAVSADHYATYGRSFLGQSRVYVCSVHTLVKRLHLAPMTPDLIVVDEAHHCIEGSTWGKVLQSYPDAHRLFVTATPCRLDGRGLSMADAMIEGPTMAELIEHGHLSPYRAFCPPTALDLSAVRTTAGDYNKAGLQEAMDKPTITGDVVAHYRKLSPGRRAVAFCVSVEHAEHVAATFTAAGVPAESLDGTMTTEDRSSRIERFRAGKTLVMTSVDVISEGFDMPAIETAILLRPTKSLGLYLQQVGRALRVFPGKSEAIILDHVGNIGRHGLPDADQEWTLDGKKKRTRKQDSEPDINISTCKECFTVFERKAKKCPNCGTEITPMPRVIDEESGELLEVDRQAMKVKMKKENSSARDYDSLVALGMSRQYAHPEAWARKMMEIRERYAKR